MPLAAAIASEPSTECSPFTPIARNTSGSQSPSDAEMTCGLKPRFCSGAVSARRVAPALGLVSYTSMSLRPGAAASSTSRSSVASPPGGNGCLSPTAKPLTGGTPRPKQLAKVVRSVKWKPSISISATRSPCAVQAGSEQRREAVGGLVLAGVNPCTDKAGAQPDGVPVSGAADDGCAAPAWALTSARTPALALARTPWTRGCKTSR